jgi:hypothetical protein
MEPLTARRPPGGRTRCTTSGRARCPPRWRPRSPPGPLRWRTAAAPWRRASPASPGCLGGGAAVFWGEGALRRRRLVGWLVGGVSWAAGRPLKHCPGPGVGAAQGQLHPPSPVQGHGHGTHASSQRNQAQRPRGCCVWPGKVPVATLTQTRARCAAAPAGLPPTAAPVAPPYSPSRDVKRARVAMHRLFKVGTCAVAILGPCNPARARCARRLHLCN